MCQISNSVNRLNQIIVRIASFRLVGAERTGEGERLLTHYLGRCAMSRNFFITGL